MHLYNIYNKILCRLTIIVCLTAILPAKAIAVSDTKSIRTFGDYMQVINPLCALATATQERGIGHFGLIYGQTMIATHGVKLISTAAKWQPSTRPRTIGKKIRYDGMPSGHTASAWSAASYVRVFGQEHKMLSIPLYITASITAYSRVKAKEHTATQVIAGAALAELVTYINSILDWSNNYRATNFYFGADELSARFVIKF